jgi:hypothetical protein
MTNRGITYMLVGMGLGAGALATYQQYRNGNLQRTVQKMKGQANNKLENMM